MSDATARLINGPFHGNTVPVYGKDYRRQVKRGVIRKYKPDVCIWAVYEWNVSFMSGEWVGFFSRYEDQSGKIVKPPAPRYGRKPAKGYIPGENMVVLKIKVERERLAKWKVAAPHQGHAALAEWMSKACDEAALKYADRREAKEEKRQDTLSVIAGQIQTIISVLPEEDGASLP